MITTRERLDQAASRPRGRAGRDLLVVMVWLVVLLGGGAAGAVVSDRLDSAVEPVASAESMRVRQTLEAASGQGDTIIALIPDSSAGTVARTTSRLRALPGVHGVRSSADGELPLPTGGGTALGVTLRAGQDDEAEDATVDAVTDAFRGYPRGQVLVGGYPVVDRELGATAEADLVRAEAVALPVVLILLGVAVRSVLGSVLGLALVLTTVTGALALLLGLSAVTTVSTFALNVVTMFGMGMAVDYGLLVITRFRRERAGGVAVEQAVAATMATAGRTVAFSGLTVAVALAGLLAFAEPVVRSMAYGGIGAVVIAVAASLTLMPAMLRRLGHRIPPAPTRAAEGPAGHGFGRVARLVQRRPLLSAVATVALLAVLALPLTGLRLDGLDARALPADSMARQDTHALEQRLPDLARTPITVVADAELTDPAVAEYVERLRGIREVVTATSSTVGPDGPTVIAVRVAGPAAGQDAMAVVAEIRTIDPGFRTEVGGLAARDHDFIASLLARAPYAGAVTALGTFLVLLLVTGGILVAAKAVLMNVVSLAASLGALVWIFQEGHLAGALGFTPTGGLELLIVVLAAVFAFGLSTDYEVFLLSAVMAARQQGHDTDAAVASGIARTGRTITTAAVLIVVVFVGFAAGDLLIIKQLGVGLAVAVLLDATLVRLVLTPALMTLFKERNWTGPRFAHHASRRLWRHRDGSQVQDLSTAGRWTSSRGRQS